MTLFRPPVGNQLPILLISFIVTGTVPRAGWESVTNPLDKLSERSFPVGFFVGNQLPILLISFTSLSDFISNGWESVTNPLDKLYDLVALQKVLLGISYQSS